MQVIKLSNRRSDLLPAVRIKNLEKYKKYFAWNQLCSFCSTDTIASHTLTGDAEVGKFTTRLGVRNWCSLWCIISRSTAEYYTCISTWFDFYIRIPHRAGFKSIIKLWNRRHVINSNWKHNIYYVNTFDACVSVLVHKHQAENTMSVALTL
jgi:hypothetical protein